jgi:hypothetical protein
MKRLFFAALALCLAGLAQAGMYDKPYAIAESGDNSETRKESRVAITKVDGKSTRNARKTDPIEPGKHKITLHFESARSIFRPEFLDVEMDFEACTRYRIVARYEVKTGPDWKPHVYSEPIGECVKKFAKKEAPAK